MKRILICLLFSVVFLFSGCDQKVKIVNNLNGQEYFNSLIRSEVVDKEGHMYYLYENTTHRHAYYYNFQLEHRTDCKACLDIFD